MHIQRTEAKKSPSRYRLVRQQQRYYTYAVGWAYINQCINQLRLSSGVNQSFELPDAT